MAQAPVAKNGNQAAPPPAVAPMTIEAALEFIQAEGPRGFPDPLRGCPEGHRVPGNGRRLRAPRRERARSGPSSRR